MLDSPPADISSPALDSSQTKQAEQQSRQGGSGHLSFLDGIRGLAAFSVVLTHVYGAVNFWSPAGAYPRVFGSALKVFDVAQVPVIAFIVLSGYCLMLPAARRANGRLPGGTRSFLARRAVRILPPYFAALVLSVVAVIALAAFAPPGDARIYRAELGVGSLLSHLFMVHNLTPWWSRTLNAPLWTVATEWHIYFVFALALIPLWRRFGVGAAALASFIIGYGVFAAFPAWTSGGCPWYLGLFGLGMAAAVIQNSPGPQRAAAYSRIRWGLVAAVLFAASVGYCVLRRGWYHQHAYLADPFLGAACAALILWCATVRRKTTGRPLLLRVFEHPASLWLGATSYSLYLIHYPLLHICSQVLLGANMPPVLRAALLMGAAVPLVVGAAYLFHLAFERPCLRKLAAMRERRETAASTPSGAVANGRA